VIVPPAQGTFGDMSRYELYSVGTWEWDASIVRAWQIKERLTTQFRADFYNVTNSTFFAAPTATLNAPNTFGTATSTPDTNSPFVPPAQGTFGDMSRYELYSVGTWEWDASIVGTGGPRKIQLGLKFLF
jgi:hypothetical protein